MKRNVGAFILLALGVTFVVIGCLRGEPMTVLRKAATLCLECIGIG
ncbi:thioredoxin [Eubacteriales bacterium OttesenSCG-928-N13]|nr:thioredoxin [Eubacteriales bacterium OttesenSCG-928-N13]